ncbi:hypothetical protein BCL57_000718 [Agromyces flavus]|uniref:Uncharacterized protein n=1 Tax=Agromyces flavus TaxID=589382 RepID=A0A1H1Y3L8_9MICO|nr:hypothetical protein [Agromyces flavus]MCP2366576.1 hypothetical protein [Agromyces flavus]GGI44950.1 hypothetical protein GCM10010932_07180 [Agromyces flavus]SDT15972.1 hypothetical protein SAMN04489721_2649 [Agromyces flavus]
MSDNDDILSRFAAGEGEHLPPAPERVDTSGSSDDVPGANTNPDDDRTSPASEAETAAKQADPVPEQVVDDVDARDIRAVPGTGGPDDAGDVDVDPDELNLPGHPS